MLTQEVFSNTSSIKKPQASWYNISLTQKEKTVP